MKFVVGGGPRLFVSLYRGDGLVHHPALSNLRPYLIYIFSYVRYPGRQEGT